MYQILENYIQLVFENEKNKNKTFKDILNSLKNSQNPKKVLRNTDPIERNTDQIGFDQLIKKSSNSNQTR
jgi:hypothetical protein